MIGPSWKVKDGLFFGDEEAAEDWEFVTENKVTHIINCCNQLISNKWDALGVKYLNYSWLDNDRQIILDARDVITNKVYDFIEEAADDAESTLIVSVNGQSRSCCLIVAYLMKKHQWKLQKCIEFLVARRPDLKLRPSLMRQLEAYEKRLLSQLKVPLRSDWEAVATCSTESEQLMLANTHHNSQIGICKGPPRAPPKKDSETTYMPQRLSWSDNMTNDQTKLECSEPAVPHKEGDAVKSILKSRLTPRSDSEGHKKGAACNKDISTISVKTPRGVVQCRPDQIVHKRYGLKLQCKTIILEYMVPECGLRAHHPIAVQLDGGHVKKCSSTGKDDVLAKQSDKATAERLQREHAPWLTGVSVEQLAELVGRLRNGAGVQGNSP